jgi:ABC-2 type transport system permease protein
VSRSLLAVVLLGFTTWPIFWKSWEVTALGVRAEQWEGTFESMVPMPNGVRSLPFGYLMNRIPFTVLFNLLVLTALALALPEGTLRLDRPRAILDLAAVLALGIACMWGLGLLFGGLAILYKRIGPVDLVVRTLFIFLAGVFVPIEVFPAWAQVVASLLPMTYAYQLLQQIVVDGIPLGEDPFALGALLTFTAASVVGGNLVYRTYVEKARRQGAIQGY